MKKYKLLSLCKKTPSVLVGTKSLIICVVIVVIVQGLQGAVVLMQHYTTGCTEHIPVAYVQSDT